MILRQAEKLLRLYSRQFRAVAVVGPRQSGKTTLVRKVFPRKPYISLENPDERQMATDDPRGFLSRFKRGAVIDEAQRVPELFNYLQQILDDSDKDGLFILTGSNNFLLQPSVTQSLAGRIGYVDLLPLSFDELRSAGYESLDTHQVILRGLYPEIWDKNRNHEIWYASYIRTYVERDVRQLRNIENTVLFNRFIQLCAGRIGQQLSVAALSNECGVEVRTVNAWLAILTSSYIITFLQPHYKNFNKRIVKTPKLYFLDTGLACSLLGIRKADELEYSHFKGALFENLVVCEILKQKVNRGSASRLYYWRDNKGVEIDVLIDTGNRLFPIEIKSAQTHQQSHFKALRQWNRFSSNVGGLLIYDGQLEMGSSDDIDTANWRSVKRKVASVL